MDVRPIAATAGALLVQMTLAAAAAPFVAGNPQPLSVRIDGCRAAVVVRPADATGWNVEVIVHDSTGAVRIGQTVRPKPAPPAGAQIALLISNLDRTVSAVPLSPAAAEYVTSLPSADAAAEDRLAFACQHLESDDAFVAEDAFAELATFADRDLARHRAQLPADTLRAVIAKGETPAERIGLYGYLLGLCGEAEDANRLRRRLFTADGIATGAAGLAAGYVMLAGEDGLADLETHVLMVPNMSPLLAAAVFEAIDYLRREPTARFTRERLRRAACCGLARPDLADLAVGCLAAGRDWEALPEVASLLADESDSTTRRAGQVSAVRFLLECQRDRDSVPELRARAERLLEEVAMRDSDLLRRATLLSGGVDGGPR